ncbi:hypothetical protein EV421DRAFT_1770825 [Armillaria borealis]|uniref:Uncharacterized protein n=1 Tax=Armillaria borealis TaxID=47425 RepID=A0AA39MZ57_9AGAR|nr:hypothetical protein EV421DRAFT_1770825 [Armillaria borealis]
MAMRCIEENDGVDGMALRLIGQISERSAFLVAAVGYGITRTCIVENIPPGIRSGNLKTLITQDKPMEYWNYDKKNLRAEMRFMDVYHAWLASAAVNQDPTLNQCRLTYTDEDDFYMFPEWFAPQEMNQSYVRRIVAISNIQSGMYKTCWEWTQEFDKVSPTLVYNGYWPGRNEMLLTFATSAAAQQFVDTFQTLADSLPVQLKVEEDIRDPINRGLITALSLGASRKIVVEMDQGHLRNWDEHIKSYGAVRRISAHWSNMTSRGEVVYEFDSLFKAMRALFVLAKRGKRLPQFQGVRLNFYGAKHLEPIEIMQRW